MFGIDDPSALLRPWRSLQQFTEELYAMLKGEPSAAPPTEPSDAEPRPAVDRPAGRTLSPADAPADLNGVRRQRLDTARRERPAIEPARPDRHGVRPRTPQPTDLDERRREQASSPPPPAAEPPPTPPRTRPAATGVTSSERTVIASPGDDLHGSTRRAAPFSDPLAATDAGPAPVTRTAPARERPHADTAPRPFAPSPEVDVPRPRRDDKPGPLLDIGEFANQVGGGSDAVATPLIGQIQSGSGRSYQVLLYPNGPNAEASPSDPVTVHILFMADDDFMPRDTWLVPILSYDTTDTLGNPTTTYFGQPPVWLP